MSVKMKYYIPEHGRIQNIDGTDLIKDSTSGENLIEAFKHTSKRLPKAEREKRKQFPYEILLVRKDVLALLKTRKEYREVDGRMLYDIPYVGTAELVLSNGLGVVK